MNHEFMKTFDEKSQSAVTAYKKAVASAEESFILYGEPKARKLDEAKAALMEAKRNITTEFEVGLEKEISSKRQELLKSSQISELEMANVAGLQEIVNSQLSISGGDSALEVLRSFKNDVTANQMNAMFNQLLPSLSDVDKHTLQQAQRELAGATVQAMNDIDDLRKLNLENPTMYINQVELADKSKNGAPVTSTNTIPINFDK